MNFYNSRQWERKRQRILRRDGYLCQYFKRYGRMVEANTIHHILPREQFPEYQLADWNLIALSTEAHNKMHDRDTHKLSEEGKRLAERTMLKNNIELEL